MTSVVNCLHMEYQALFSLKNNKNEFRMSSASVLHLLMLICFLSSYVQCITADSGNTIGDMTGNTKAVNSVAYKPNRPFRIATGSEDFSVQFFEGPPFKRKAEKNDHTNFVQTVRYSPNGEVFITGGSDGKVCI